MVWKTGWLENKGMPGTQIFLKNQKIQWKFNEKKSDKKGLKMKSPWKKPGNMCLDKTWFRWRFLHFKSMRAFNRVRLLWYLKPTSKSCTGICRLSKSKLQNTTWNRQFYTGMSGASRKFVQLHFSGGGIKNRRNVLEAKKNTKLNFPPGHAPWDGAVLLLGQPNLRLNFFSIQGVIAQSPSFPFLWVRSSSWTAGGLGGWYVQYANVT